MPADTRMKSSRVAIGIIQQGLVNRGNLMRKEIQITPGGDVSFDIPLRFENGVPPFQIMLSVSGNVILKKLTLKELPDELADSGITLVEGTLKELSQIPDPKKSDYPDCRFTASLEGDSIVKGVPCQRKIQLVIDGFRNYKLLGTASLKPGDKIRCFIIPFEKLPEELKTTQQADDLNLFDLPVYYASEITKLKSFSGNSAFMFTDSHGYVSVFKRQINPQLSNEVKKMQQRVIKDSLVRMTEILAPYPNEETLKNLNVRFNEAWEREKSKDLPGVNRIDHFVWRNVDNSFWVLPERYQLIQNPRAITPDKMEALLAFQDFLNANGCQLMIGVVPDMYDISARVINKEFRNVPDFRSAWLIRDLLSNGLEAVYISNKLLEEYNRHQFAFFWPDNPHPSDTFQDIFTDVFAERLSRYGFPENLDKTKFRIDLFPHAYSNNSGKYDKKSYLFPKNCDIGKNTAGTPYLCRRVLYDGKEVLPDSQSPILVLGNSFIQTPMEFPDSFPSLLSLKMRMSLSSYRIGSYGPLTTIISLIFANPEKFLTGKKVVVLVMGVHHFYGPPAHNIKTMDIQMMHLAGKAPRGTIELRGNEDNIPKRFEHLGQVRCFIVPKSGKCTVYDASMPQENVDRALVLTYCADHRLKIICNGSASTLYGCLGVYRWDRAVVPLSKETTHLTIELEGKPGMAVVLGDIQIFQ